jgi:hypothetical protein
MPSNILPSTSNCGGGGIVHTRVVQCDRGAYKTDIDVEDVDVQYMWLLHAVPTKGARTHMRVRLHLSLDSVRLIGDANDVQHVTKSVDIDVLEWEILKVRRTETPQHMSSPRFRYLHNGVHGELRMRVISYLHNFKSLELHIEAPIIVTFRKVPIIDTQLSYQELCGEVCVLMHALPPAPTPVGERRRTAGRSSRAVLRVH